VAEGTPEQVAAAADSFTGQFLAPLLEGTDVRVARAPRKKAATPATSAPAKKTVKKSAAKTAARQPAAKKTVKKTAAATKRAPRKTRKLTAD
jgi:excinuclease ABC subunit A